MRTFRVTATPRPHRRVTDRPARLCARCLGRFIPARADAVFCCAACRQAAWRASRPHDWAVITWWGASMEARFTFHVTQAAAMRAAPADRPVTVLNIARKPWLTWPMSPYEQHAPNGGT